MPLSSMEEAAGGQISQVYLLDESKMDKGDVSLASVGLVLPHEIFFEILSWMPAKCLVRCKCVCKQWYKLIEDRSFIVKHLSRTKTVTVYFEDKVESFDVDGTIVEEKFKIMDTFAGLILEKGETLYMQKLVPATFRGLSKLWFYSEHKDGDDDQELLFVYDSKSRKLTETKFADSGPGRRYRIRPSVVTFKKNAIGDGDTKVYKQK
ncbi:hypothetical protein Dsin_027784 [Dipteronia sinensis]|uniref:F-box domain-containing protein n=1 Tax=Dipteronia sinensis TaxID=43782 RepID=A0AAD9ZPE8_9ROSI|nr:hypothetical protein Dsin_027784 [Dipteronia sinensis]